MIRVVLDTNILICALWQPQGLPVRTFLMTVAGLTAQLCVNGDIYAEYEEVIRRPLKERRHRETQGVAYDRAHLETAARKAAPMKLSIC